MRIHHDHKPDSIRKRIEQGPQESYLRDWIYGGVDGAITTFAIVSGVVGAHLSTNVILILGAANLFADGFSMAAGNFLSTRAEKRERDRVEKFERQQIKVEPEGEVEEVRQILIQKGFKGELLERVTKLYVSDPEKWVQFMVAEEYGLPLQTRNPYLSAGSTFLAFVICGLVPLLSCLLLKNDFFFWACVSTGTVFFLIGSIKSKWTTDSWLYSGFLTLLVGATAALISYFIGALLRGLAT